MDFWETVDGGAGFKWPKPKHLKHLPTNQRGMGRASCDGVIAGGWPAGGLDFLRWTCTQPSCTSSRGRDLLVDPTAKRATSLHARWGALSGRRYVGRPDAAQPETREREERSLALPNYTHRITGFNALQSVYKSQNEQ
ncbi:hypothetical protein E2562_019924 [Oryza meyeriana var. granulata]|uniref:Uncharacterized protein n=1 Tax=Oryza meyeriana var. granulata TaxID=110450 RepID=A0A6G1EXH4_9ORYZ|nr:hypothetical protein E2562_019924 [Oryza meyeriana var. granulata]